MLSFLPVLGSLMGVVLSGTPPGPKRMIVSFGEDAMMGIISWGLTPFLGVSTLRNTLCCEKIE